MKASRLLWAFLCGILSSVAAASAPDASVVVRVTDGQHLLADVRVTGAFDQPLVLAKSGVVRTTIRIARPDDRGWSDITLKLELPTTHGWHVQWETHGYLPLNRAASFYCNGANFTYRKPGTPFVCIMPRLGTGAPHYAAAQWPLVTQRKLNAIHKLLVDAHPGSARSDDPTFTAWLTDGYQQASALARHAMTEAQAGGVLRYYITGFRDAHLRIVQPQPERVGWAGWRASFRGDDLVVEYREISWPATLPSVGAIVDSCDGQSARDYVMNLLASFYDRRTELASTRRDLAALLSVDTGRIPDRRPFASCTFRAPDGMTTTLSMHWVYYDVDVLPTAMDSADASTFGKYGIDDLGNGRFWVRLPTFSPAKNELAALETITEQLRQMGSAKWVIFDLRGNQGGNSSIGSRLLEALTGGLAVTPEQMDSAPKSYALWRVSPQTVDEFRRSLQDTLRYRGLEDPSLDFRLEYWRRMDAALRTGEPWIRQDGGPVLSPTLIEQWQARPRHFTGRIALVTDDACFSACLDFIDEAIVMPGTVQLGHTTAADTNYMDVGLYSIDDNLKIQMPRKVWIGRERGNNVPYNPMRAYPGQMNADDDVRNWVRLHLE